MVEVVGACVVIEGVLVEGHIDSDAIDVIATSIGAPMVKVLVILFLIGHYSVCRLIEMGVPALCAFLVIVSIVLHVRDIFFRWVVAEYFFRLFLCLNHIFHFT